MQLTKIIFFSFCLILLFCASLGEIDIANYDQRCIGATTLPHETCELKAIPQWYYDPTTNKCHEFEWYKCKLDGPENRFPTKEECYERCSI